MKLWIIRTFKQAAWGPLLVFVFYAVAAKGFNLYLLYPRLDIPTHFLGGAAITWFFYVGIVNIQAIVGRIPSTIQLALSLGATALAAVVWEFLEFLSDFAFSTEMNLGVADTLSDLFFGLFGGVIILAAIGVHRELCVSHDS